LRKKVAITRKSYTCAKKLQLCKKVCRFLRRNSTTLQKVANAKKVTIAQNSCKYTKTCKYTKKLQMHLKVAKQQKSVAPLSYGPTNSPTKNPLALAGFPTSELRQATSKHPPINPEHCPSFLSPKMPSNLRPHVQFPCQTRADHRSVWTDIEGNQSSNQHNNCFTRPMESIETQFCIVFDSLG
jgi:hypothetical protein